MGDGDLTRECKTCGEEFTMTAEHVHWYRNHPSNLHIPSSCDLCIKKRKAEMEDKVVDQQVLEIEEPVLEGVTTVSFDTDIYELHQDAIETLSEVLDELTKRPVTQLTTFENLDRVFNAGNEIIASARLLLIISDEPEAVQTTDSSPRKSEIQVPETKSLTMEAGAS